MNTTLQEKTKLAALLNFEAILLSSTRLPASIQQQLHQAMQHEPTRFMQASRIAIKGLRDCAQEQGGRAFSFSALTPEPILNTLPVPTTQAIRAAESCTVAWTPVSHLPGHFDAQIRALATTIFSAFGLVPDGQVKMICSFSDGDFLNSPLEVNSVMGWLRDHFPCPHEDLLTLDFSPTIDNYRPKAQIYYSPTHTYLALLETEGEGLGARYIYCFERLNNAVSGLSQ